MPTCDSSCTFVQSAASVNLRTERPPGGCSRTFAFRMSATVICVDQIATAATDHFLPDKLKADVSFGLQAVGGPFAFKRLLGPVLDTVGLQRSHSR